MGYFHCLDTDTSHLSCTQHAACFFTYIDCRIQIPIYPISTCTKIYSVRKFQFFLYIATFTAFFTRREKTVYTYQFLSSPCQLIFQQFSKLSVTVIHDTFSKMHTLAHCFHVNIFYCNNIICLCYFMTQFMQKIFPLVSDFFMT